MVQFLDSELSKGDMRKLTALRKSLGPDIADETFAKWLAAKPSKADVKVDKNIQAIEDLLTPAVLSGSIRLPRGGYMITRGRGRVVVTPVG